MSTTESFTPLAGVTILGAWTEIVADPLIGRERSNFAEYHSGRCRITLDSAMAPAKQGESLIHEIIESINERLALRLRHDKLTALASALTCVLRENQGAAARVSRSEPIVEVLP